MEPESSSPYSQVPAICPYPEPTPSTPPPTSRSSILILSSHLRLGHPNGLFPSGFPTRTLSTTVIKTNQLMTYKAKAVVCSEIRTKHSTQSEHHVEFLNVIPGGM